MIDMNPNALIGTSRGWKTLGWKVPTSCDILSGENELTIRRKESGRWLAVIVLTCNFTMLLLSDKNAENAGGNNGVMSGWRTEGDK